MENEKKSILFLEHLKQLQFVSRKSTWEKKCNQTRSADTQKKVPGAAPEANAATQERSKSLRKKILPEREGGARSWVRGRVGKEAAAGGEVRVAQSGGDGRRRHGRARAAPRGGCGEKAVAGGRRCGWNPPPPCGSGREINGLSGGFPEGNI